MSKGAPIIENAVPRLYRANALNLLMFGFVTGQRELAPGETIKSCIYRFMDAFGLQEGDDFNADSACVAYSKMSSTMRETRKYEKQNNNN